MRTDGNQSWSQPGSCRGSHQHFAQTIDFSGLEHQLGAAGGLLQEGRLGATTRAPPPSRRHANQSPGLSPFLQANQELQEFPQVLLTGVHGGWETEKSLLHGSEILEGLRDSKHIS